MSNFTILGIKLGYLRVTLYLFILFTGGFLIRKNIPCMVWAPELGLGKKSTGNAFLLFVIILIKLLHLIRATEWTLASTNTTDVMHVKNSRHHLYLRHFFLVLFFRNIQIKVDKNQ